MAFSICPQSVSSPAIRRLLQIRDLVFMRMHKPNSKNEAKPMATVSEIIAEWIEKCNYEDLPIETIEIAKRNILDCIGTSLAGSREPVARILKEYLKIIE